MTQGNPVEGAATGMELNSRETFLLKTFTATMGFPTPEHMEGRFSFVSSFNAMYGVARALVRSRKIYLPGNRRRNLGERKKRSRC